MNTAVTVITAVLLLSASALALLTTLGLVRFRTILARSHPVTKVITIGVVAVCAAGALRVEDPSDAARLILVAILQIITAPIAGHMVARSAHRAGSGGARELEVDELRDKEEQTQPPV